MTQRRDFIKATIATSLLSTLPLSYQAVSATGPKIKPKRLKPGDTLGLIAQAAILGKMKK